MGAGRKTQTFVLNDAAQFPPNQPISSVTNRNLGKNHLGGVIFGCKNTTIKECLFKQLFGLPASHFSYIKNIDPGLPLFLFNYSGRKLHGIFEAASSGQMNINPYAWTTDGSGRTPYPAQVQVCIRLQCNPLPEEQFKPIILDNYYTSDHFWFELDHAQTSKLLSLLSCQAVAPGTVSPKNTKNWRTLFRAPILHDKRDESEGFEPPVLEDCFPDSHMSEEFGVSDVSMSLGCNNNAVKDWSGKEVTEKEEVEEKDQIYMKLKELAQNRESSYSPTLVAKDTATVNEKGLLQTQTDSEERKSGNVVNSSNYASVVAQLVREIEGLKAFNEEQNEKMVSMDKKLVTAETEIEKLKSRCASLESSSDASAITDVMNLDSAGPLELDLQDSLFLVGGYDGVNWLSALDSYSPTHDVMRSLKPMNSVRSYASVVKLNNEIYAIGGGDGSSWYDTVEAYDLANDKWALRPSLNVAKGSLAGGILSNKIFAIGGGNGLECFADVEMLDLDAERWISTQSMLQQRFALAAVELNGALYAVGGFNGDGYLKSAERFDPREHSWTKIEDMNMKRGCHSLVVLNEKLYAIGGHDGDAMVSSVEIYDPRLCLWMVGEPMKHSRGYSGAVVLKESIYVMGGLVSDTTTVETVERYKEGQGWEVTNLNAIGRRCFFSAIAL